jgi:hypothetical protein
MTFRTRLAALTVAVASLLGGTALVAVAPAQAAEIKIQANAPGSESPVVLERLTTTEPSQVYASVVIRHPDTPNEALMATVWLGCGTSRPEHYNTFVQNTLKNTTTTLYPRVVAPAGATCELQLTVTNGSGPHVGNHVFVTGSAIATHPGTRFLQGAKPADMAARRLGVGDRFAVLNPVMTPPVGSLVYATSDIKVTTCSMTGGDEGLCGTPDQSGSTVRVRFRAISYDASGSVCQDLDLADKEWAIHHLVHHKMIGSQGSFTVPSCAAKVFLQTLVEVTDGADVVAHKAGGLTTARVA